MDKQDEREEREYEVKKHEPEWRFLCSGIASLVLSVIAGVVLRIRSIHVIAVILICMVVVGLCISFLRRNKELTKLKKRIVCFVMGLCVLIIIVLMFLFNGLHVHKWNPTLIKDATCILKGEVIRECECGEVEIEVIPLTDHNWIDASCAEPKTCMICQKTEGTSLRHDEVKLEGYAATCMNTGLTDGSGCSRCGTTIKEQTVIKALGHKEVTLKGYVETCTTDGRTDGKECSRCGVTIEEQKTIKALGHKEVALKGYAETCTTAGLTDGIKCSRCDDVIANQTTIEATGHSYVDDGTKMYCSVCGHVAATWVMVDDWTQDVLTAGIDEKIITRATTVTKYRYYSCMFWSDSSLDIVSGSEAHAQKNRTWNGVWLSDTSWKEIGENVCTGLFIVGKQGKSNGKYVRVATRWYDSPQNPMPNCIEKSPCFEEDIMQQTVTEYQRWKLVYE